MERINTVIKQWKAESGCNGVIQFNYTSSTGNLIIYTAYVGYLIGKSGCLVDKYRDILKSEVYGFESVKFVETSVYSA